MAHTTHNKTQTGPSRDMVGGPWLGVAVFLIIAVGLGWGLTKLFQSQLSQASQSLNEAELNHGFDPDTVYTLKRPLILGYLSDGRKTLFPAREDLPVNAPGRRSAARIAELRGSIDNFPDLIGVVNEQTRVRFVEVIDDRDNPQTRVMVMVRLLDGPYAQRAPVLGMHLESADTVEGGAEATTRYVPRPDLFQPRAPVQSSVAKEQEQ